MKIVVFCTGTPNNEKFAGSVTCLGHETHVVQYDVPGVDIVRVLEQHRPDVAIYVGAIRQFHNPHVPDTETLCRANRVAPMILFCCDAADTPWWPLLEEFHHVGAFRLMVSIDGCHDSPMSRLGVVDLTPIDETLFAETAWEDRIHACGFAGGWGHRTPELTYLTGQGCLTVMEDHGKVRYPQVCAFYTLCKTAWNDARTGTGHKRHVKGRFVEAAMAGALVIEPHDSPAMDWFKPNEDYLVWHSVEEAAAHIRALPTQSDRYAEMAKRLKMLVRTHCGARAFWGRTFARAGLK